MKHTLAPLAAALFLLGAGSAHSMDMTQRKPGLWEVQTSTQGGPMAQMPDMGETLAKMPPEQRAMVERMMKERGVGMGGKPNSFRYCMTKAQVERDDMQTDPDTECTKKVSNTSASSGTFSFSCKRKDGSTMSGEGRVSDVTPESYAMDMHMKVQGGQGQAMDMQVSQKARWLGADCQGLKPLGQAGK